MEIHEYPDYPDYPSCPVSLGEHLRGDEEEKTSFSLLEAKEDEISGDEWRLMLVWDMAGIDITDLFN